MNYDDFGALLIGTHLIAFFAAYLYGHRHGRRDQFETHQRDDRIIL